MYRCKRCYGRIVLNGFSEGNCYVCKQIFMCEHTPPDKICSECCKTENLCKSCGENLE